MKGILSALLVLFVLVVVGGATFVVGEPEQVIITQFGRPVGQPITTPGLRFKLPIIQSVHRFDKRFLEWDGDANELPTRDKRFIYVDTYARWQIKDPLLFFQRLQNERGAQTRLDDILDGETRNAIANHDLVEVIRSTNRQAETDTTQKDVEATLSPIKYGRDKIRREILDHARERTKDLGIEVLDIRFKRINYVEDVQRKVYDRMIAERQRIADRFRSEGQGEASRINGEMTRKLKQIQSEAYRKAQEIKGTADAKAAAIYAGAYDRSADSRSFYAFLKSMETLRGTVGDDTSLLLSTDGELYRFLRQSGRP